MIGSSVRSFLLNGGGILYIRGELSIFSASDASDASDWQLMEIV